MPLSLGTAAQAATSRTAGIGPASIDATRIDSWIVVQPTGRVRIQVGKVELGTALRTAQMQIAADELDVSMKPDRLPPGRHLVHACGLGHDGGQPVCQDSVGRGVLARRCRGSRGASWTLRPSGSASPSGPADRERRRRQREERPGEEGELRRADRRTEVQSQDHRQSRAEETGELKVVAGRYRRRPTGEGARPAGVRPEPPGPRDAPRPGRAPAGDQRDARLGRRLPEANPGLVRVVVEKDFVGVVCQREEQAVRAARRLRVSWNDPGGVPTYDQLYSSMESRWDGPPPGFRRRCRQGTGRRGEGRGDLLLPLPAARLDGPLRDRGRPGKRSLSGRPHRACTRCARVARMFGLQSGTSTSSTRKARVLRPERRRHRLARRGAAVEPSGGRARAVDAPGRARLGALRHTDGDEAPGGLDATTAT